MSESHTVPLREEEIVEQFVGDNHFSMPDQELVNWVMPFPRNTPDPDPVIVEATQGRK